MPDRPAVIERLRDYYTLPEALVWLKSPHPLLDGRTPTAVIMDEGQAGYDRLHAILDGLDAGVYL
jgi:uncharacterized protein (DUF2384 family)